MYVLDHDIWNGNYVHLILYQTKFWHGVDKVGCYGKTGVRIKGYELMHPRQFKERWKYNFWDWIKLYVSHGNSQKKGRNI